MPIFINSQIINCIYLYTLSFSIIIPIWLYLISLVKYYSQPAALVLIVMFFGVLLLNWAVIQKIKNKKLSFYALYTIGVVMQIACTINIVKIGFVNIEILAYIVMLTTISILCICICCLNLPIYEDEYFDIINKKIKKTLFISSLLVYVPVIIIIKFNNNKMKVVLHNKLLSDSVKQHDVINMLNSVKLEILIVLTIGILFMLYKFKNDIGRD